MGPLRLIAIVLVVGGALGLAYGSFSYTKATHKAEIGALQFSIDEKQSVNVPSWVGLGAVLIGGVLLLLGGRRS